MANRVPALCALRFAALQLECGCRKDLLEVPGVGLRWAQTVQTERGTGLKGGRGPHSSLGDACRALQGTRHPSLHTSSPCCRYRAVCLQKALLLLLLTRVCVCVCTCDTSLAAHATQNGTHASRKGPQPRSARRAHCCMHTSVLAGRGAASHKHQHDCKCMPNGKHVQRQLWHVTSRECACMPALLLGGGCQHSTSDTRLMETTAPISP